MRFVMFMHNDPRSYAEWEALSSEEKQADIAKHQEWFGRHGAQGSIAGGEELALPSKGRVVRKREGRVMVTDGPFIETREVLGGFVIIEAPDMATVEAMAAEWPGLGRWNAILEIVPTDPTTPG